MRKVHLSLRKSLKKNKKTHQINIKTLESKTPIDLWWEDLINFIKLYNKIYKKSKQISTL